MKKYAFDEKTVSELSRISFQLYKTFSSANKTVLESNDRLISSNFVNDYNSRPEDFYSFRWKDKYCWIYFHKKAKLYTVICEHFKPKNLDLFIPDSMFDLYKKAYGRYHDIHEARNAFADIVNDLTKFDTMDLF